MVEFNQCSSYHSVCDCVCVCVLLCIRMRNEVLFKLRRIVERKPFAHLFLVKSICVDAN